jgi:hypothetical protein
MPVDRVSSHQTRGFRLVSLLSKDRLACPLDLIILGEFFSKNRMDYDNPAQQVVRLSKTLNDRGVAYNGRRIRISEDCANYCFTPFREAIGSLLFGFEVVEVSGPETVVYLGSSDEEKLNDSGPEPPDYPVTETLYDPDGTL